MFEAWLNRKRIDMVSNQYTTGLIDDEVLKLSTDLGYAEISGNAVRFKQNKYLPQAAYGYTIVLYILSGYDVLRYNSTEYQDDIQLGIRAYCTGRTMTIPEFFDAVAIKSLPSYGLLVDVLSNMYHNEPRLKWQETIHYKITTILNDHDIQANDYKLYPYVYEVFIKDRYSDDIAVCIEYLYENDFFNSEDEYSKLVADIDHKPWVKFEIKVDPDEVDDWEFVVDFNSYFVDNVIEKHQIATVDADGDEIPREDIEETAIDTWVTRNFAKLVASSLADEGGEYFKPQATGTPEATIITELELPKQQEGQSDDDFARLVAETKKRRSAS